MSEILIKVPSLGESVTEATIARLFKNTGESVLEGDVVIELETDKVTLEVAAPATGVIQQLSVSEGDNVNIGDVLGSIVAGAVVEAAKPVFEKKAEEKNDAAPVPSVEKQEAFVSPAAAKMMAEEKINASDIAGTGKDGRITKEDVILAKEKPAEKPVVSPVLSTSLTQVSEGLEAERKPMSPLRKKIAERLKHAQNTAAILTTFNECDMSTVMELRKNYQDEFVKKHGTKLGFMSFFVKACVAALKDIPAVNAEIQGDDILYHRRYDIGVAVSAPQGLVVPVLRNTDNLGLHDIEKTIAGFGEKAKAGKLTMADMTGGTFTISNGGVFGSLMSAPILNPPQSGILGMHKIQERPVAIGGQIVIRPMMYLALSYDHRIIDGREAVTFLVKIKDYIENPTRLLMGL